MSTSMTATVAKAFGFWACFWLLLTILRQGVMPPPMGPAVAGVLITVLSLLLITVLLRTDGLSRHDVGLGFASKTVPQFVLGLGIGFLIAAAMIATVLFLTPIEISPVQDSNILAVLGVSFLILFSLGLMEEVAFRSYAFFRLQQAWGVRPAIYISSIAFAFYHGLAFENLLGPGVWGLLFGWMAVTTKSIALPTGVHVGLNWLQALVGMKPHYGSSIWELSIGSGTGLVDAESLGLSMQLFLLVVAIGMIEILVRKQRASLNP